MSDSNFEIVIIGGSYAGLSAALALGRARRKVLVVDAGEPCNRFTPHAQNFLTRDGTPPAELRRLAMADVKKYPTVTFREARVTKLDGELDEFQVFFGENESATARRVIIAVGVVDLLEDIPGLAECWGTSVIHCPYCHGYEYNDQPTGYLSNTPDTPGFPKMLLNWTPDVTVFTNGPAEFEPEALQKMNVSLNEQKIVELRHEAGCLREVVLEGGETVSLAALYYRPPFRLGSASIAGLAPELQESGHIKTDAQQRTSIPGIFAVGDCAHPMRSVAIAVAAGNVAGAMANHDLI
ncbi:NAD(P)/FAD-dependent oxidoreductase [Neolewinella aurantiaca]|nr:NAD(P)/FAD-dependent oxidoreductase [Neolewinella aurantiaca]